MKTNIKLTRKDFGLLSRYVKKNLTGANYTIKKLNEELKTAEVLEEVHFPEDVVRINSMVRIKVEGDKKEMLIRLVMPMEADIKQNKISVFAPIGTALIGYKENDIVEWEVPGGVKVFKILEVVNELDVAS